MYIQQLHMVNWYVVLTQHSTCYSFLKVEDFAYSVFFFVLFRYNSTLNIDLYKAVGWTISAFGIIQLPLWATHAVIKQKGDTWGEKIRAAFQPNSNWGPTDPVRKEKYLKYIANWQNEIAANPPTSILQKLKQKIYHWWRHNINNKQSWFKFVTFRKLSSIYTYKIGINLSKTLVEERDSPYKRSCSTPQFQLD